MRFVRVIEGGMSMFVVKDIMTKKVFTVYKNDTVEECAKLMLENEISSIPVIDCAGNLVGIITEKDLIKKASRIKVPAALELLGGFIYLDSPKKFMEEIKQAMSQIVKDMMTKKLITVEMDDSIEKATTRIVEGKVKRLPVVNSDGKLVGIISRRDIMIFLYEIITIALKGIPKGENHSFWNPSFWESNYFKI